MYKIWFFILITVYCDCLAQTDNSTTNIKSQNIEESNSSRNASDESVNLENGTNVAVPPKITSADRTFTTTYKEDVTLPCRYTGSPIPVVTWTINHVKFSRDAAGRIKQLPNGSLLIRDPASTDTGEYSCQVRNDFGQDVKTYRLVVKTPPKAPSVQLVSTTNNSLTINIKPSDNEEEPILGYSVHYKEEFGEWETIQIADEKEFTIDNLLCGSRYRLYVNAFNNIGQGEPSDTIQLKIKGTKPIIPKIDKFIVVLSTSAVLHFRAFPDGDCSLLYFVIELKKKIDNEWNQINNRTQPGGKLVIQGLDPGYWYQLRVTAHNSAGFSVGEYEFATLFVRYLQHSSWLKNGIKSPKFLNSIVLVLQDDRVDWCKDDPNRTKVVCARNTSKQRRTYNCQLWMVHQHLFDRSVRGENQGYQSNKNVFEQLYIYTP